jgi:hypothetical protein
MSSLQTIHEIFALSPDVRYVAVRIDDALDLQDRPDLSDGSKSESDRYEELLVNPTVLGLTSERGRIDCGGLEFVLIRYGKFFALVHPILSGHVTVGIARTADPLAIVAPLRRILAERQLLPPFNKELRDP